MIPVPDLPRLTLPNPTANDWSIHYVHGQNNINVDGTARPPGKHPNVVESFRSPTTCPPILHPQNARLWGLKEAYPSKAQPMPTNDKSDVFLEYDNGYMRKEDPARAMMYPAFMYAREGLPRCSTQNFIVSAQVDPVTMEMSIGACWGCVKKGQSELCSIFGMRLPFDPEGKCLRYKHSRHFQYGLRNQVDELDEDDQKDGDYSEPGDDDQEEQDRNITRKKKSKSAKRQRGPNNSVNVRADPKRKLGPAPHLSNDGPRDRFPGGGFRLSGERGNVNDLTGDDGGASNQGGSSNQVRIYMASKRIVRLSATASVGASGSSSMTMTQPTSGGSGRT